MTGQINYVLQPSNESAPVGMTLLVDEDGAALFIKDDSIHLVFKYIITTEIVLFFLPVTVYSMFFIGRD